MFKKINNQGYALVLVVIIVAIVVSLTSTMLFSLNTEMNLNLQIEEKERTNYLAQAGIEHGLMLIEEKEPLSPLPEDILLNDGTFIHSYQVTELSENKISATGEIQENGVIKSSVKITAEISSSGQVTLSEE